MLYYWICSACGLIHKNDIPICSCNFKRESGLRVHFESESHLDKWVTDMRKYMGAKVRIARGE